MHRSITRGAGLGGESVGLSLGMEGVSGVLQIATCFPRQGKAKAGVCGGAIRTEGSGERMGRMPVLEGRMFSGCILQQS